MSEGHHWQSSSLPLFVKTVWGEGHHHVLLGREDAAGRAKSGNKKRRRRVGFGEREGDRGFGVSTVKVLLEDLGSKRVDRSVKAFEEVAVCSKCGERKS